jgi:peptidoglycan hydrolase-like protein with peptidoglycan-binding domain
VLRLSTSTVLVRGVGQLTVSGRLYRATNSPGVGAALDVLGRTPGTAPWAVLGRMTTDSTGLASLSLVPRVSREYRLRTTSAPLLSSGTATVAVQPVLSAALTPRVTEVGRTGVVAGRLVPAYAGAQVKVQRRLATGWSTVRTVTPDAAGAYRAVLAGDSLGRHVYRTALLATPAHRAATSALLERVVEGRSLRSGDRGADVLGLQQRLVAQKVDVGPVDGVFGYDLRHAVTAFQKSQGLPRTGVYDKATSARLAAPRAVHLRYPSRGRAVEVDIARQVLYLSEGGRLIRIVDVSTGSDRLYESDGVTYKAYTPTGRFSVQRKIDGVRVSRLGELYRPAYFTQGWAVHGSGNVPVYPDSHGCVRVTNPAMDRLFPLLTIGVPVSVYR